MEVNELKEVFFDVYCPTCRFYGKAEEDSPCDDCLDEPVNTNSHKPVHWKKGDSDAKVLRKSSESK